MESGSETVVRNVTPKRLILTEAVVRPTTPEITVEREEDCLTPSEPVVFDPMKLTDEESSDNLAVFRGAFGLARPTTNDLQSRGTSLKSSRRRTAVEEPYVFSRAQLTLGTEFRRLSDPVSCRLIARPSDYHAPPMASWMEPGCSFGGNQPPTTDSICAGASGGSPCLTPTMDARRGEDVYRDFPVMPQRSVPRAKSPFLCLPELSTRPRSQSLGCTRLEAIEEEHTMPIPKVSRRYSSPAAAKTGI